MTSLSVISELFTPPAVVVGFNSSDVTNEVSKAGSDTGSVGVIVDDDAVAVDDTPLAALMAFTVVPAPAIKFRGVDCADVRFVDPGATV